ncbi:MAG TPA: response regulator [Acidiferrobacteraceae bacterium]|nr:response regulator [Acidiferrobacteraceae bacterium]
MPRVLIVDDEESVRVMVAAMIKPDGYNVTEAASGAEACDACKESPVDLIITDIVMPEKNGIDLIRYVKKEYPDIAVIAISGGGGIEGRYDYLEIARLVGADNILKKPFELRELRSAVSEAMKSCATSE